MYLNFLLVFTLISQYALFFKITTYDFRLELIFLPTIIEYQCQTEKIIVILNLKGTNIVFVPKSLVDDRIHR